MISIGVPRERFPDLGTVANPAVFCDGENAFICYEVSQSAGGGSAVLKFDGVIEFRLLPVNVEGLVSSRYLVSPWAFNEILGCHETSLSKFCDARFWIVSFNDVTIEILFETVSIISRDSRKAPLQKILIETLLQENIYTR